MTKRLALIGMFAAMTAAAQLALASLPNIEVVSFLLFIYAMYMPLKDSLMTAFIFTCLQGLMWGFGEWVFGYMWVWSLWVVIVYLLKDIIKQNLYWAIIHSIWGIIFGFLFAINYGLFYGWNFTVAYWLRGIAFDITHSIGNYIVAIVLIPPVRSTIEKMNIGGINV